MHFKDIVLRFDFFVEYDFKTPCIVYRLISTDPVRRNNLELKKVASKKIKQLSPSHAIKESTHVELLAFA